jgi:uncharacterized protein DUF1877
MLELPAETASTLRAGASRLPDAIKASKVYSDVYRYWHAIEYLLTRHAPTSSAARWLDLGTTVSTAVGEIPAARLIPANEVAELDRLLQGIEPEHLIPHYDAAAMDAAAVYPATWQEWEETFDPLGQVLEHYSFLQFRARGCATAGHSLLLVFEELADGAV